MNVMVLGYGIWTYRRLMAWAGTVSDGDTLSHETTSLNTNTCLCSHPAREYVKAAVARIASRHKLCRLADKLPVLRWGANDHLLVNEFLEVEIKQCGLLHERTACTESAC